MRTALAISLFAALSASCGATAATAPPRVTPEGVRFVLDRPAARSVSLAGSFNDWSLVSHPLAREATRGIWTALVRLPPGEHVFMYVVDGTDWISPPLAEDYVDDGFGARNGIVVVRPVR
jgi:1,4-alpha-glucan branching enzyme